MEKKFRLTDKTTCFCGKTLYQIEALKDFGDIKAGNLGGYVEKAENLSQIDDCWIYDGAAVYGNANVCCNAKVYGGALVYGYAKVSGYAEVYGYAEVFGAAKIYSNAKVYGGALVYGYAKVSGYAEVYGYAEVFGAAKIYSNAKVYGYAEVFGAAKIYSNAVVQSNSDYIVFKNWWSSGRYFTWLRSINKWKVGCFFGTGEELVNKAYKDSELSGIEYQRVVNYVQDILGLPHINYNKNV